jgi:hypothetical protein
MYLLSVHIFKDRVAASFSAVLYMFTPFYIGHLLSYLHYTGVTCWPRSCTSLY